MYSAIVTTLITMLDEKGEVIAELEYTELGFLDKDPREDPRVKAQAESNAQQMFMQNKVEREQFKF